MANDKPEPGTPAPAGVRSETKGDTKAGAKASHEVADAVVAPGHTVVHGDPDGVATRYGPGETVTLYVDEIEHLTAAGFLVEETTDEEGGTQSRGVNIRGSGPAVKPKDAK
jgi:hypothetical protein